MRNSIISLILLWGWASLAGARVNPADLAEGAPDRYVVVPGDTLSGLAARFLKNPGRWPELWKMSRDQIKNPNRIYPGDALMLDRSAEEMRLKLSRADTVKLSPQARSTSIAAQAIPAIPATDIEPFLSKPLVIAPNQLDSAARIVRTQESRVALAAGNVAYAQGVTKDQGTYWHFFRPGAPLVDPQTQEVLGQEAIYLGDARVDKFGDVSTLEIVKSPLEIYAGDYLLPAPREVAFTNYVPHSPSRKINAQIIAAYGSLFEVRNNVVVAINRGSRDGLEVGHVLAICRNLNASTQPLRESSLWGRRGLIYDENNPRTSYVNEPLRTREAPFYGRVGIFSHRYKDTKSNLPAVGLPDERYGLMMVFRVFERASYALIMKANRQVNVLDIAANP
jgi:hypothetical protein